MHSMHLRIKFITNSASESNIIQKLTAIIVDWVKDNKCQELQYRGHYDIAQQREWAGQ